MVKGAKGKEALDSRGSEALQNGYASCGKASVKPNFKSPYFRQLRRVYCGELMLLSFFPELLAQAGGRETAACLRTAIEHSRQRRDCIDRCAADHGISAGGDDCEQLRCMIDRERKLLTIAKPPLDDRLIEAMSSVLSFVRGNIRLAWKSAEDLGLETDATRLVTQHEALTSFLSALRAPKEPLALH